MPIYEYRCASCGFQGEYLQKVADPPRTVCPECGQATFQKLLTAAGFQLKGSGWYATDFKGKGTAPGKAGAGTKADAETKADDAKGADEAKAKESKPATGASDASTTGS